MGAPDLGEDSRTEEPPTEPSRRVSAFLRNWFSCIVVAAVLVPVLAVQPWRTYLDQPPIRSDALGYHLWVRAILDGDLDFCRFQIDTGAVIQFKRPTANDPDHVRCGNQYPPGLALLQLPVMALLADHGADPQIANSRENDAVLVMAGCALLLTCVLLVATARRLRLRPWPTHLALLTMVFGTALFVLSTYAAGFTHAYLALGVAMLLWAGTRTRQEGSHVGPAIVAFLAAFFIVAIRNIDIIIVGVLVIAYVAVSIERRAGGWSIPARRLAIELAPVVVGVLLASTFQIVVNHHFSGVWSLSSYGVKFDWSRQMQRSVLVSYRRGLFSYWPIIAVVLVAGFAVRRARAWTLLFAVLIAVITAIYGFWPNWELGGGAGFGHRGFVEIVPVGIIAFAGALSALRRPLQVAVGGLAIICALLTFQLALQMWNYEYPEYTPTGHEYWSHMIGSDSLWRRWLP